MKNTLEPLLQNYWDWLRTNTEIREISGGQYVCIDTPYTDRHGDCLQIFVSGDPSGNLTLTDGGYILDDLEASGCPVASGNRRRLLDSILNGFGVKRQDNALTVSASMGNFPERKHAILQAMLAVNDLFFTASPTVTSLFLEDVTTWLHSNLEHWPVERVQLTGHSGLPYPIDFLFSPSAKTPERILQAVNEIGKTTTSSLLLTRMELLKVREKTEMYVLYNDEAKEMDAKYGAALAQEGIQHFAWSNRAALLPRLAG